MAAIEQPEPDLHAQGETPNRGLRVVLAAFLAFNAVEIATWVAILLYAYEAIGPASVGLVALLQLLPAALAAPPCAVLGDRYPRERVLSGGYLVQAIAEFATAGAMLGGLPPPVVLLFGAAAATSLVVTRPTQNALLPSLARTPAELTTANGAAGAAEGVGLLIGPLVAAGVLAFSVPGAVFAVGSAFMLAAAVATSVLKPDAGHASVAALAPIARDDRGVLAGLRTIVGDPDGRLVVGLMTARMVMLGAADVIFVFLALELIGSGQAGVGILSAALGAGAIVGGATTIVVAGRGRFHIVAAVGAAAWGTALIAAAATRSPFLAPIFIVGGAAGLSMVDIAARTILQRAVRDAVLTRVFGLQEGLSMGGQALGAVLVPVIVAAIGLVPGIIVVAAVLPVLVALGWPRLVSLDARTKPPVRELELLRTTALFRPLPLPQLEAVARRATWVTAPAGATIIAEGDPGDRFYVLASGALRVERARQFIRELTEPGEGFGEIALLRAVPRTATVTAIRPTTLLAIDRAPFLAAVTGHPAAFAAAESVVDRARM